MAAGLNFGVECEVSEALVGDIIYHIPSLFKCCERSFDIDVCDRTTITVTIEQRSNTNSFLEGGLYTKRNKLISISGKVFHYDFGEQHFIGRHQFCCTGFTRNLLAVDFVIFVESELVFCAVDNVEDFLTETVGCTGVIYITELVLSGVAKALHCFVDTNNTNGIIQMLEINESVSEVREKSLFCVAANDATNNIKHLTIQLNQVAEGDEVIILCLVFKSKTSKVYCGYFYRTNFECGSADRVEVSKVFDIGLQAAAVGKRSNAVINKDVGVGPFHIVFYTPTSKFFIFELAVFSQ